MFSFIVDLFTKTKSGVSFESSIPKENGWDFKRRKGTRQEKETFYKEDIG